MPFIPGFPMPLRLSLSLFALTAALAGPAAASTCSDPDEGLDPNQRVADCEAELGRIWDRSGAPNLVFNQGRALRLLGRNDEALPLLNEALRYNPERALYWAELARLYLAFAEPGTAAAMFSQAVVLEPQDPYARADRAEAWFDLGRVQACLDDLDATLPALRGAEDEAWFLTLQGRCQDAAGHPGDALASFDAALQARPDWFDALAYKAQAQFNAGLYAEAVQTSGLALDPARFPDLSADWEVSLRGTRIEALIFLGRPATEAAAEVAALKARLPGDHGVMNLEAWQLFLTGDIAAADAAAQPVRALDQPTGYMVDTLGQIDLALGRTDAALQEFETAAWLEPGVAQSWRAGLVAQGYLPQTRLADDILRVLRRCIQDRGADCSVKPLPVVAPQVVKVARPAREPAASPAAASPEAPGFDPEPAAPPGIEEPAPVPPALGRAPSPLRKAP